MKYDAIKRYRNYQRLSTRYLSTLQVPRTQAESVQVRSAIEAMDRTESHFFHYALREAMDNGLEAEEEKQSPFLLRWKLKAPRYIADMKKAMTVREFIHQFAP